MRQIVFQLADGFSGKTFHNLAEVRGITVSELICKFSGGAGRIFREQTVQIFHSDIGQIVDEFASHLGRKNVTEIMRTDADLLGNQIEGQRFAEVKVDVIDRPLDQHGTPARQVMDEFLQKKAAMLLQPFMYSLTVGKNAELVDFQLEIPGKIGGGNGPLDMAAELDPIAEYSFRPVFHGHIAKLPEKIRMQAFERVWQGIRAREIDCGEMKFRHG